jgi:hypothetical protein
MDNVHFKPNGKDQLLKKIMKKDLLFRNEIFQMFLKVLALPPPPLQKKRVQNTFPNKIGYLYFKLSSNVPGKSVLSFYRIIS